MPKYLVQKIPAGSNRYWKGGNPDAWTNNLSEAKQYKSKKAATIAASIIEKKRGVKTALYTYVPKGEL
jgi:O-glycosyl hydrolase